MTTQQRDRANAITEEIEKLESWKVQINSMKDPWLTLKENYNGITLFDEFMPISQKDLINIYLTKIDIRIQQLSDEFENL